MIVKRIDELSRNRVSIVLENGFSFVLYKGELRLYKIKVDEDIDSAAWDEIMNKLLPKRAKLRAMNLLKLKSYTEKGLRDKLNEGGYPPQIIDAAIEYVASFHYIDDRQYAQDYISTYQDRRSRKQLRQALLNKGVAKDIIDEAIADFFDEADVNPEEAQIRAILKKKGYFDRDFDYNERNKLMASIYRKGYSTELIYKIMGSSSEDELC